MRCLLLLVALGACSHQIAPPKPRAWFSQFDVDPKSEPLPQGMAKPRPKVFAVGARIPIETSWSAICKTPYTSGGNFGQTQYDIHDCEKVPHVAVVICDPATCQVDPPDEKYFYATSIVTLKAPGRYSLRVQFSFGEGEREVVTLPAIEAVLPDDVAMRCITDDVNLTVEVSLTRGGEVIPGAPSIVPGSGTCKPTGIAYDSHAAVFECPLQSPGLAQWVDAKITAPNISRRLNSNCERRPRP